MEEQDLLEEGGPLILGLNLQLLQPCLPASKFKNFLSSTSLIWATLNTS